MHKINLIVNYLKRKYGVPLHNFFKNRTRSTSHLNLTWGSDFLIVFIRTQNKLSMTGFSQIWKIRCFAVVNYMVRKFSFCSNFYVDVLANIYLLIFLTDSKTVFISWSMILKLKSFIQIGTVISHKKFLTPHVAVYLLDETINLMKPYILLWYITWLPHLCGTIFKNTLFGNRFYKLNLKKIHIVVYIGQVSGRSNYNFFAGRCFIDP